jgi:hypothetical protein
MTTTRRTVLVLIGFTLLALGVAVAYALAPLPNRGFRDAAAALAVITAAAVGIERVIGLAVAGFLATAVSGPSATPIAIAPDPVGIVMT